MKINNREGKKKLLLLIFDSFMVLSFCVNFNRIFRDFLIIYRTNIIKITYGNSCLIYQLNGIYSIETGLLLKGHTWCLYEYLQNVDTLYCRNVHSYVAKKKLNVLNHLIIHLVSGKKAFNLYT